MRVTFAMLFVSVGAAASALIVMQVSVTAGGYQGTPPTALRRSRGRTTPRSTKARTKERGDGPPAHATAAATSAAAAQLRSHESICAGWWQAVRPVPQECATACSVRPRHGSDSHRRARAVAVTCAHVRSAAVCVRYHASRSSIARCNSLSVHCTLRTQLYCDHDGTQSDLANAIVAIVQHEHACARVPCGTAVAAVRIPTDAYA